MTSSLFSIFNRYPSLVVALSEKKDGPMNFIGELEQDQQRAENRKRFLERFGIDINSLVSCKLVHGNNVQIVTKKESNSIIGDTDGLLTKENNLFLSITVADCLPIFIYDNENGVVGLVHGGWRGLAKNILENALQKLIDNFHSRRKDIVIGIGPGISKCHFEVGEEVLNYFQPFLKEALVERESRKFLDLKKIAYLQLIKLGIPKRDIEINPSCTYCLSDRYFSHRRDRPKIPETMMAVIGKKR